MQNQEQLLQAGNDLLSRGVEIDKIKLKLSESGVSENDLDGLMAQIKKAYYDRRRKRGFTTVLIGSFLLVFGFVITLVLFHTGDSISYAMYTLTTIGVVLLIWGMADIMGW